MIQPASRSSLAICSTARATSRNAARKSKRRRHLRFNWHALEILKSYPCRSLNRAWHLVAKRWKTILPENDPKFGKVTDVGCILSWLVPTYIQIYDFNIKHDTYESFLSSSAMICTNPFWSPQFLSSSVQDRFGLRITARPFPSLTSVTRPKSRSERRQQSSEQFKGIFFIACPLLVNCELVFSLADSTIL